MVIPVLQSGYIGVTTAGSRSAGRVQALCCAVGIGTVSLVLALPTAANGQAASVNPAIQAVYLRKDTGGTRFDGVGVVNGGGALPFS